MKFFKIYKGEFNYINRRRIYEIMKTVVLFAFAIGLYLLGYLTLKTNKSLWSVFAVLSVLPAAKSAVSMIMFIRFSSISKDEFELINGSAGKVNTIYELVFTTREKSYFVKALSCCNNTVVALFEGYKDGQKAGVLAKELREHIEATLQRDGIKGCSVKIFTGLDEYCARLREMDIKLSEDESYKAVFHTIKAVTL